MRRQGQVFNVSRNAVPDCFSGCAEVGWRVGPTHLEDTRDNNEGVCIRYRCWQDVSKVILVLRGDDHSPEAIFEVDFCKEERGGSR